MPRAAGFPRISRTATFRGCPPRSGRSFREFGQRRWDRRAGSQGLRPRRSPYLMCTFAWMPEAPAFRDFVAREFAPYGALSSLQLDQLENHYRLLERWNTRMNLTRIRRIEDVVRLHYCESLFLGTLLPAGDLSIADIGSGAGFPG